jgi:hypothetical protein
VFNQQISAGASLSVTVTGFSNPTLTQSQVTNLKAATYNSGTVSAANQIGESTTGVLPEIVIGGLGANQPTVTLTPASKNTVVTTTIVFTPQIAVPMNGKLVITLIGISCNPNPSSCTATGTTITSTGSVLTIAFSSSLPAEVSKTVVISNTKTQTSGQSSSTVEAATYNSATVDLTTRIGSGVGTIVGFN